MGAVARLQRFPLRSAAGESPGSARLLPGGLEHDRGWHLLDAGGEPVTARTAPGLAALGAAAGPGGGLVVDGVPVPVGGVGGVGGAAPPWVELLGGAGARVVAAAEPHRAGAALHLVSEGAADDPRAPAGCDPGGRANVVLDLLGADPGDERGWGGLRLAVGERAVVVVTRAPRRCLGVYADVLVPGEVRVGDPVVLLDPAPPPPDGP